MYPQLIDPIIKHYDLYIQFCFLLLIFMIKILGHIYWGENVYEFSKLSWNQKWNSLSK